MKPGMAFLLSALVVIICLPSGAMPADVTNLYQAGIAAFEDGDYEKSFKYFRKAEAQGIKSPGLIYNLGVTCYRLGRYQEAEQEFLRLADNPDWRYLAYYNLGLVSEAKGDRQAALAYYMKARQSAGKSKIRHLAALKIEKLRPEKPGPVTGKWFAMVSAAAGYDNNAVLAPDKGFDEISEEGDFFTELFGLGSMYATGNKNDGVRLYAEAYGRFYSSETDYSFASYTAGMARDRRWSLWHASLEAEVAAEFAGDELYSLGPCLRLSGERQLSYNFTLKLSNTLSWIGAGGDYDYLSGIENRLAAKLSRIIPEGKVYADFYLEYNNRDDLEAAGDEFFSYSPYRAGLGAGMDWMPASGLTFVLYGSYRKSLYPDENRMTDSNGDILVDKREDDRLLVSLRCEYMLFESIDAFAEYRTTNNESNLPGYGYESSRVMFGLQKFF